jgi:hypothetical protein
LFLSACQSDQDLTQVNKTIQVVDGRLKFFDQDHFLETVLSVQQGNTDVVDGKVLDLNYKSYYSTFSDPTLVSEDFEILDLFEYKVLLNRDREVQVGERIYLFNNEEVEIYDLKGNLLETSKNEVGYYNREEKSFISKDNALGRSFNAWYWAQGPQVIAPPQPGVWFRWYRTVVLMRINYYYEARYHSSISPTSQTNVEFFERIISDCYSLSCVYPTSNPYGGFSYNTSTVRYHCGGNTHANEANYSTLLRANYKIKPYGWSQPFEVFHQDDLVY